MTNEQAKNYLNAKLECLKLETSGTDFCNHTNCDDCSLCYEQGNMGEQKEALDMAIKALEQSPILDKVRDEIQKLRGCSCSCSDGIIDDVEDIIDKYKAEREVEE